MNVSHVMRRSFATIKPEASLLEAAHLLLETDQRGLPVIDGEGGLVGIISEGDFLHRVELDIDPPPGNWLEEILGTKEDTPARRRMQARVVRDAMTCNPVWDKRSMKRILAAAGITCFSFCRPSRGPTSTILTCLGILVIGLLNRLYIYQRRLRIHHLAFLI